MADKSFYNEHDNWTQIASECDREVAAALRPIFEKWIAEGYSPREIAHIVCGAAMHHESMTIIRKGMVRRQAENAAREAAKAQETTTPKEPDDGNG